MSEIKVSVCLPVYNGEKHIGKAIQSVLDQSFTDFELLIIDNLSTDKTLEVIYGFTDDRIRVIENKKNVGMVGNWNLCLDNSNGKYIQFICHDDYLAENCLEKKVKAFDKDDDISLVFSASYIVNDHDKVVMRRRDYSSDKLFEGKTLAHKSFVRKNIYGEPSNVMFKKELSEKVGHFDERLCYTVDWDYWIKISSSRKVYFISDFLMYYRISHASATSNLGKAKEKLLQDDKQFVKNCLNNKNLGLNKIDIVLHVFNREFRIFARKVFSKLNAHRR